MESTDVMKSTYRRRYVMSANGLFSESRGVMQIDEHFAGLALKRVDEHRRRRLEQGERNRAWAERLAAGVLLQYALGEYLNAFDSCSGKKEKLQEVFLERILKEERPCVEPVCYYGENGKPYLQNFPLYFSLSHSMGRILCAVSEKDIGADIQYPVQTANGNSERESQLLNRFFSEKEKRQWKELAEEKRQAYFYRLWTQKEAYGKLTGRGLLDTIGKGIEEFDDESHSDPLIWEAYQYDGAYISICYRE